MEKKEKTDFLLEQVRLCLDCKDYVRAMIIIRKINTKVFADESMQVGHNLAMTFITITPIRPQNFTLGTMKFTSFSHNTHALGIEDALL